jgi:hypothetical protein
MSTLIAAAGASLRVHILGHDLEPCVGVNVKVFLDLAGVVVSCNDVNWKKWPGWHLFACKFGRGDKGTSASDLPDGEHFLNIFGPANLTRRPCLMQGAVMVL